MNNEKIFYPVNCKDKIIYVTDWSNINNENKLIEKIWETTSFLVEMNKHNLLEMIIFRNSVVTKNVLLEMQKAAKVARLFNKKKADVFDFSPTRLFILKTINRFSQDKIEPFNTEEKALEWLAGE